MSPGRGTGGLSIVGNGRAEAVMPIVWDHAGMDGDEGGGEDFSGSDTRGVLGCVGRWEFESSRGTGRWGGG